MSCRTASDVKPTGERSHEPLRFPAFAGPTGRPFRFASHDKATISMRCDTIQAAALTRHHELLPRLARSPTHGQRTNAQAPRFSISRNGATRAAPKICSLSCAGKRTFEKAWSAVPWPSKAPQNGLSEENLGRSCGGRRGAAGRNAVGVARPAVPSGSLRRLGGAQGRAG